MTIAPQTPKQKSMPLQDISFDEKVLPLFSASRCQYITNQPSNVKKTSENDPEQSARYNKEPIASDVNRQQIYYDKAASFRQTSIKLEHATKMANCSRRRLMLYELSKLQQMEDAKYQFSPFFLCKTKTCLQKGSTFEPIEVSSLTIALLSNIKLSGYRLNRLRHKQHLKEFRRHFAVKKMSL